MTKASDSTNRSSQPGRTKRSSIETAGVEDLVMLDGTPDDSALDSVLLPEPKVEKRPRATPPQPHVAQASPGAPATKQVDLDLAADLSFEPPHDTDNYSLESVVERLEDVPEAGSMPDAGDALEDVPEAGALPDGGMVVVPEVGPLCASTPPPDSPSSAPSDVAAGMGFATLDPVDESDEPEDNLPARDRSLSRAPSPHIWVLVFGIACGVVAVAGMIWTRM